MKTAFTVLILFLFAPALVEAQDFRSAAWGMSAEQIRKIETIELESQRMPDGSVMLSGHDNVIGIPAMVTFSFIQNKLVQGTTAFLNLKIGDNPKSAETNLTRIQDGLITKYGKSTSSEESPLGGLKLGWQTQTTDIFLASGTSDNTPFAMALYYSRELANLRQLTRQKELRDKF